MEHAYALEQDEAMVLASGLKDRTEKMIGRSHVIYGRDEENYDYFIVLPPIGEAVVVKRICQGVSISLELHP